MDSFGSNATSMGGSAGRCDGMISAVESQKAEGAFLHVHAFVYLQSVHQFSTLSELAEKLREGMTSSEAFKQYVSYVRCAQYPDVEQFEKNRAQLGEE